jgi:hypothetical protein
MFDIGGGSDETDLQNCILERYDLGMTDPAEIADYCDCSQSYVREVLNDHRSGWKDNNSGIL